MTKTATYPVRDAAVLIIPESLNCRVLKARNRVKIIVVELEQTVKAY